MRMKKLFGLIAVAALLVLPFFASAQLATSTIITEVTTGVSTATAVLAALVGVLFGFAVSVGLFWLAIRWFSRLTGISMGGGRRRR